MKQRIVEKLADLSVAADPGKVTPELLKKTAYLDEFAKNLNVPPEKIGTAAQEALSVLLNDYSDFRVSTIDSFFQSVLRTFAYESNLNDSYQVEIDSDFLIAAAIDSTLNDINTPGMADTPASRWIKILTAEAAQAGGGWNVFQKSTATRSIYSTLRRSLRMMESEEFKEIRAALDDFFISTSETASLETVYLSLKDRMERPLRESLENTQNLAHKLEKALKNAGIDASADCHRYLSGHLKKIRNLTFDLSLSSPLIFKPLNLEGKSLLKKGVKNTEESAVTRIAREMYEAYNEWINAHTSPQWLHWQVYAPLLPYLGLLGEARLKMNEFMDSNNLIQLGETNSMLRQIIGDDDAPFIYERLGSVINHFLIDEFQDTSRMQWENLQPLLRESDSRGEDNLIIGDAKQSIYRFRNADPSLITSFVPSLFPDHLSAGMSREENTNWRSDRTIVEFNNLFFSLLAPRVDSFKMGNLDFSDLYGNVAQFPKHRERAGYVEVRFLEGTPTDEEKKAGKTTDDLLTEKALAQLGSLISSMMARNIQQRDIAILVDTNEDGKSVISALVDYNTTLKAGERKIDFISEESLLVSQSEAVGIVLNVLRYIASGMDMNLTFFSLRHPELSPAESVAGFLNNESPRKEIDALLADMQAETLPAIVEAVIEKYVPMEMRRSQALFLAAFQDMVLEYTDRYTSDIASFINWWDSKGKLRSISSPEGTDAVRIMTVHKSKGLEFGCVILPLANISLEPEMKAEWRWVKPASIFSDCGLPPYLPVSTTKNLLDTEHAPLYTEYHDLYMMDKLNSVYVAFTRAVNELYVFTRPSKKRGHIGMLLKEFLNPPDDGSFEILLDTSDPELLLPRPLIKVSEDEAIITIGEKKLRTEAVPKAEKDKENGVEERLIEEYGVDSSPAILHYVEGETGDTSTLSPSPNDDDPRSEGNLLHGVMEKVEKATDLHNAILSMRMRGMISNQQAREWEPMLERALSNPEVAIWFDGSRKVVNERDIIYPRQKNRRPDRIMFNADRSEAIIVDYKFGAEPDNNAHKKQVKEYMELIREAIRPKKIYGYVWYVRQGKVMKV